MRDDLREVKRYLQNRYRALYRVPDWDFVEETELPIMQVLWVWQTSDLNVAHTSEDANGAAILDPDVGICLYVQRFNAKLPVRNQVARALQIRSRLLRERRATTDLTDKFGAWRVVVYWLVEEAELPEWIAQVAELRERTAHFEEVPVDAIIRSQGTWQDACVDHGFPRLLFELRSVFYKEKRSEVEDWQSADAAVLRGLSDFDSRFHEGLVRECAKMVGEFISNESQRSKRDYPRFEDESLDLVSLSVNDFRNVGEINIDFRTSAETVASTVIQGPNGSGKSSLFEALSIAVGQTSSRHIGYLSDRNRMMWGRDDHYVENYLTSLSATGETPKIGLNGLPPQAIELASSDRAEAQMADMAGTFLSQESSRSFVAMTASDLGAEIAASFSAIAEAVSDFVESRFSAAQERQRSFNSKWGLRANVTRRETVIEKVATRSIDEIVPNFDGIIAWLRSESLAPFAFYNELSESAEALADCREALGSVTRSIASASDRVAIATAIKNYLEDLIECSRRTEAMLRGISDRTSEWYEDIPDRLEQWGNWLQKQAEGTAPAVSSAIAEARQKERALTRELESATQSGRILSDRAKHLEAISSFLKSWSEQHDAICPTCDSDVSERGGIRSVVATLHDHIEAQTDSLRNENRGLRERLTEVTEELSGLGAAAPPLEVDERADLSRHLSWMLVDGQNIETFIQHAGQRDALKRVVLHLMRIPAFPELPSNVQNLAESIAKEIADVADEYEEAANLPLAWKDIRKQIRSVLGDVTAQHLPKTLQALWVEIARNMMPAPWQYPGQIGFRVGVRRLNSEVAIVVKQGSREVLANFILNVAEVHNLGLAWFFAKYMTFGRFKHRYVVLDDPAHSMDQPTYRDFCRLLETILRLHKIKNRPLSLVLLLHQDSRALDAAHATDAVLHVLRWNRGTPIRLRRIKLHGEQFAAPQPAAVLEAS